MKNYLNESRANQWKHLLWCLFIQDSLPSCGDLTESGGRANQSLNSFWLFSYDDKSNRECVRRRMAEKEGRMGEGEDVTFML